MSGVLTTVQAARCKGVDDVDRLMLVFGSMKVTYLLPGLIVAAVGFCVLFGLLFSVHALAKDRQFAAFRTLASGGAGRTKRWLFFAGGAALVLGTCGTFGGVARSDAERGRACARWCIDKGYAEGVIGQSATTPSTTPAARAFVACTCNGGAAGAAPLETGADDLAF